MNVVVRTATQALVAKRGVTTTASFAAPASHSLRFSTSPATVSSSPSPSLSLSFSLPLSLSPLFTTLPLDDTQGTKYGGKHTVTLIPGDGIGREMTDAVRAVFRAAGAPVEWEVVHLLPDNDGKVDLTVAYDSLRRNRVGLKGRHFHLFYLSPLSLILVPLPSLFPLGVLFTPIIRTGSQSFNLSIRKELDLFANLVLCKSIPGYPSKHKDVDIVVIRENTEGEYSGLEHEVYPGVVESMKVITAHNSERIAKFAFDYALLKGRKKVTAVHKANIMYTHSSSTFPHPATSPLLFLLLFVCLFVCCWIAGNSGMGSSWRPARECPSCTRASNSIP